MSDRIRRNRNENYDQSDIDLFLDLVENHKHLIESMKQDDKKRGWELIQQSFNTNCKGPQRDVPALRMKLKNLKAHSRRSTGKSDDSTLVELEEIHTDEDGSQFKVLIAKKRKRSKMFTQAEQNLLQSLVEKYSECLDITQTREAIATRNRSWQTIYEEFNAAKLNIDRELSELKIKYKNMKSNGMSFSCNESHDQSSFTIAEEEYAPSPPSKKVNLRVKPVDTPIKVVKINRSPKKKASELRNIEMEDDSEDECDTEDDIDDLNYIPIAKKVNVLPKLETSAADKDEIRLRKENMLLKNACLRKKERLLELQIALAERELRRISSTEKYI